LHSITLRDTNPVGTTPLDEGSVRRRHLYLYNTKHTQEKSIQEPAGIEPAILPSERPQTHAFDREATTIGLLEVINDKMEEKEAVVAQ
jgi:hypothetical protein